MPRIKLKKVDQISRTTVSYAFTAFMRHCKLKNLSPYSYLYYDKNISFFLVENPEIKYVDEITWEKIENFISKLMDRGNRVTAINARLRALFAFLRYCFDQEYLEEYTLTLIKEDETLKEPYTEAELQKLLKRPQGDSWAEWRAWAVVNLLVATGVRASTVDNIRIYGGSGKPGRFSAPCLQSVHIVHIELKGIPQPFGRGIVVAATGLEPVTPSM